MRIQFEARKVTPSRVCAVAQDGSLGTRTGIALLSRVTDNLVSVVVNGVDAGFAPSFEQVVPLIEGANALTAVANDIAGNATTPTIIMTLEKPPVVRITSPLNLAALGATPITFAGTVSDPGGTVKVIAMDIGGSGKTGLWRSWSEK